MKVVLFGNNERGCLCLEEVAKYFQVPLVVTLPAILQPRWSRSILDVANTRGIPHFVAGDNIHDENLAPTVASYEPDVIVLAGWPLLVSEEIINIPTKACINLHAGPVPSYRGSSVINWQIINGETTIGISILQVTPGIDSGPLLMSLQFPISTNDTYYDVLKHILDVYPIMLVDVLRRIDIICPIPQTGDVTIYSHRLPKDGQIDWDKTDVEIHNLIRALVMPMPGAFTYCSGKLLTIERSRLIKTTYKGIPGRIVAHWKDGVVVACGNRGLLLTHVRQGDETVPINDIELENGELK